MKVVLDLVFTGLVVLAVSLIGTGYTARQVNRAIREDRLTVARYVRKRFNELGESAKGDAVATEIAGKEALS